MGRRHSVAARDELRLLEQGSLILHSAVMRAVAAEPADSPFLSCLTLLAALKASARLCPSRKAGLGAGSRGEAGQPSALSFCLLGAGDQQTGGTACRAALCQCDRWWAAAY